MMAAMPAPKKTLYEILGVPREASADEISSAYQERVAELEAMRPPDPGAAALVRQAYEILGNPARRAQYDATLPPTAGLDAVPAAPRADDPPLPPEEAARRRRLSWPLMAALAALSLVILYYALRPGRLPDPQTPPSTPPDASAPAAVPPPAPAAPKAITSADILKEATAASGVLSSIEMSGRSTPIGIALAIEPGAMVTTCHAIPAGAKLVVELNNERLPADLGITDEELDLCRLSVAGLAAKPFTLATEPPKPGDRVFTTGVNSANQFALTEGTVEQLRKVPTGQVLELSIPVAASASGGGVFDTQGRLVAIATTQYKHASGDNIALPVQWLPELRSRGAAAPAPEAPK